MEKVLPSNTSSLELDRDQPIVLVTTRAHLEKAGIDMRTLHAAGRQIQLGIGALTAGQLYLHSNVAHPQGAVKSSEIASLLTAEELALRMDCTARAVYQREQAGELFSVLPPARVKGRRFPAFQLQSRLD